MKVKELIAELQKYDGKLNVELFLFENNLVLMMRDKLLTIGTDKSAPSSIVLTNFDTTLAIPIEDN